MMMRSLVRLYPASWRRRYGDEFEALLDLQAASVRVVLDVLFGAVDAQLEKGRGGSTMATRLRTPPALAITVGSLMWLVGSLPLTHVLQPAPWYAILQIIGMPLVALGMVRLALVHERGRTLTVGVAAIAALGLVLGAAVETAIMIGTLAWIGDVATWPVIIGSLGLAAEVVFAVVALAERVLPRIPLAAIAIVALVVGLSSYLAPDYVTWGLVLLPATWLLLGLAILQSHPRTAIV